MYKGTVGKHRCNLRKGSDDHCEFTVVPKELINV